MKLVGFALILFAFLVTAKENEEKYYSFSGLCEHYIYIFDIEGEQYEKYAKYNISDWHGDYVLYFYTEGRMSKIAEELYELKTKENEGYTLGVLNWDDSILLSENGINRVMHVCDAKVANLLITNTIDFLGETKSNKAPPL